jgi:hypothetical protein
VDEKFQSRGILTCRKIVFEARFDSEEEKQKECFIRKNNCANNKKYDRMLIYKCTWRLKRHFLAGGQY